MTSYINSLKQFLSLGEVFGAFVGLGATTCGALELADGEPIGDLNKGLSGIKGSAKVLIGTALTQSSLYGLGLNESTRNVVDKSFALIGTTSVAGKGLINLCNGIYQKSLGKIAKGAGQFAAGLASTAFVNSLRARTVSTLSNTFALATLSSYIAYSGIKDVARGNYAKGVAKTIGGIAGVALSGYVVHAELYQPTYWVPGEELLNEKDPPPFNPDEEHDREIKIATIFNNQNNVHRDQISDFVSKNHKRYAEKWNLDHDVVTENMMKNQCTNPFTNKPADCSAYFNKIQYFRNECAKQQIPGIEKWVIYADDDAVFTNPNINPYRAIDQLREGKNTSIIMIQEGTDWQPWFFPPHMKHDPRTAVNSGFIIARIDPKTCNFMERTWEHRNTPVWDMIDPDCATVGFCKNQDRSLGDQTAMALALKDDMNVIDRDISLPLPRDLSSQNRAHIAFNTFHRGGCFARVQKDWATVPIDIDELADNKYPDGKWRQGDWVGQPPGFAVTGRYPLPRDENGKCKDDLTLPIENIRLKKIHEMTSLMPKDRRITIGTTYVDDGNSPESQYSYLAIRNHAQYARTHSAKFHVVTENLLKDQCKVPETGKMADCGPYWNKVKMVLDWLNQPVTLNDTEEWFFYGDDDGVYANMGLDPSKVIDDLRGKTDSSIIVAKDLIPWYYNSPEISINSGFMIFRKNEASRQIVQEWWDQRDVLSHDPTNPICQTHGLCKNQIASLVDQEGFALILKQKPHLIGNEISVAEIRDPHLNYAVNSVVRDGCFVRDQANWKTSFVNFEDADRTNPSGIGKKGDLFIQAAGVPRMGIYCHESTNTKPHPIRKWYVKRMLKLVENNK